MSVLDRLKRLLGLGDTPPETSGEDVTVHLEHPGMEGDDGEAATADLKDIKGIGPTYATRLRDAGIDDVADLAEADPAALAERTDISETRLATWIERARAHLEGP